MEFVRFTRTLRWHIRKSRPMHTVCGEVISESRVEQRISNLPYAQALAGRGHRVCKNCLRMKDAATT